MCLWLWQNPRSPETRRKAGCQPHHEHVVLDTSLLNGELQVAHGPESGLVGGGAIIDHGDGFGIMLLARPVFEDLSETVVGHDDMFINLRDGINVIQHTSKDGRLTDLEQWLGEVLCQLSKSCGIASSNNDIFHKTLFFLNTNRSDLHEYFSSHSVEGPSV